MDDLTVKDIVDPAVEDGILPEELVERMYGHLENIGIDNPSRLSLDSMYSVLHAIASTVMESSSTLKRLERRYKNIQK